jgi:hypothetical protein
VAATLNVFVNRSFTAPGGEGDGEETKKKAKRTMNEITFELVADGFISLCGGTSIRYWM